MTRARSTARAKAVRDMMQARPAARTEGSRLRGVTAPRGFRAAGVAAGIRKEGLDVALVVSDSPAAAAGVFTRNRLAAAPVVVSREHLRLSRGRARVVVLNAGCANAATGAKGIASARATARLAAGLAGCAPREVLICSTGVIGAPLPMPPLRAGVRSGFAALSPRGGAAAARAILTTDTRAKEAGARIAVPGGEIIVGGMAKGAGMIHPDMATLLAVVTTDAAVPPRALAALARYAAERSFNRISVDGDTSTNDTLLLLANGASGVPMRPGAREWDRFRDGVTRVCGELAEMIVRDGEGASLVASVLVTGAPSERAALQVAKTIATSPLVKTALAGRQANWGRVLAAAGRSGVPFAPERASVTFGRLVVYRRGRPLRVRAEAVKRAYARDPFPVVVDLAAGRSSASVLTCDFTRGYVDVNGSYIS
jgi:glutamate N-acetyltransferase/amino-acid N-acetyltransferase